MQRMVPTVFIGLIVSLFGGTRKVAIRLWPHIPSSADLLWRLGRLHDASPDKGTWMTCMQQLSETLTPTVLLDATVQLSPEGRRRDPDVVQLEESILQSVDSQGHWDWR